jgi:uncharacterized glyoxalase superfamily protein PhnB
MAVPKDSHSINAFFLVANGERMLAFLKNVFGATLTERHNRPDGTIIHADVRLGDSRLMLAEASPQFPPRGQMVYVYVDDPDATHALAQHHGAKQLAPMADQEYGDRTGGFEDPDGNWWWVAKRIRERTPEEIAKNNQA